MLTHRIHYWYKLPKNRLTVINAQQKFSVAKGEMSHWAAFCTFMDRKRPFECSFVFSGVMCSVIPKNMLKWLQCIWNFLSFDEQCETTCQSTKSHLWFHFRVLLLWNPPKSNDKNIYNNKNHYKSSMRIVLTSRINHLYQSGWIRIFKIKFET